MEEKIENQEKVEEQSKKKRFSIWGDPVAEIEF